MMVGSGGSVVALGLLGSLLAGACTSLGALPIFFRSTWSERAQSIMLAAAAGIMLGATVFSLLVPGIEIASTRTDSTTLGVLVVSVGFLLGALAIWGMHALVPHEHFVRGVDGRAPTINLGRNWLFVLAIALHNFPEGMSVGVAFGGGLEAGIPVALGIGLQNLPEGLAVAAALMADGASRQRAFWVASATGAVEPLGGLLGAWAVATSAALLPWGLAFAAGAMFFVIFGEIVPETHREGEERTATVSVVLGFVVMMILDVALG